jgi:hypothetical protein
MRAAMADNWLSRVRQAVYETLGSQVLEAAERVEEGSKQPVTDAMAQRWQEELVETQRPYFYGMTVAGYELAEQEFGEEKSAPRDEKTKQEGVSIGDDNAFLQLPRPQDVEVYLEETSKLETATSRKKIDAIFQRSFAFVDPDTGRGMTPKDIARMLEAQGIAQSKARAELIARTSTIWCYNEGAQQEYFSMGVLSESWLVTEDDVLCDFCRAMDGVTVPINEAFWAAGSSMEVTIDDSRRGLGFPFDIQHPPLHPYCRCAVIPNV